jgi:glucose-1-phosphate adenylyltransferase
MIEKTIALILGGGVGSRLYPLTRDRSKPAVPIGGKYRLVDIPISNCLNSNLRRMYVLTQYNSASLNRHIKRAYNFDIFSTAFVDILAAEQNRHGTDWFQGTADAVRRCLPRLENHSYEYIIILSGDQLYQMDFRDILNFNIDKGADLTVATIPVVADDATGFGILKVNNEEEIIDFVEKPPMDTLDQWASPLDEKYTSQGKDYLASMGIYVFKKEILIELLKAMPKAMDFGKEIIPYAVTKDQYKTCSYPFGGYWTDIGSIKSYFDANLTLTDFLPQFNLYHNDNKIYTNARMLSPTKIFGTRVNHTLISGGCIIHAESIERSVIGVRSRIGPRTTIKNAIVMGNDYYQALDDISEKSQSKLLGIGKDCKIENVILDKNVKIGNFVTIVGHKDLKDDEQNEYCIRDGIIILKKGATIADNARIGKF